MIDRFRSILFVFQGYLAVALIIVDGGEKAIVRLAMNFRVRVLLN